MQRILPRGEIEALDHNVIPRVSLPDRASVFATRAARLRQLAADSPVADYLLLMAQLVDAQQRALKDCAAPEASEDRVALAQAHGMPPLQAIGWPRDPMWRNILAQLVDEVSRGKNVPAEAIEVCAALRRAVDEDPESLEDLAEAVLAEQDQGVDSAAAPFVMAALQVYWTDLASRFDDKQLPVVSPFGVCPVCASLPVASVVRVGGQFEGYRYLCCSLCATQWHMVRVKCTHCEDVESVAYQAIDGRSPAIKAETCDHCHTYRKIFYQDKDLHVEPVADDLASLMLDVLVGEAGYSRASGNPLLWHGAEE
ncbi:formate dehydrogenase accessory protein FdhE [Achromobacter marplatensis]|uniref:Protein FdhE homolog n=1 Tax=Achromobacter marplatensis TaxID=470868 RepID=A0AA42WIM3_9BURK|nr:formate dehydrogenase accessory protein FdhE [Achromobacter marplatensis]MDH2054547.1 formate dehydrogenase accessory protein FdhE [Achromobacter marplatensis]OWT56660.1 formate dehydrogenase accessory protein FdhE [Achromobacter marplatensis]RBP12379.1 Tat proofreading chaperone FdhE [Achromobacter marplatensis]CAB3705291.1 Protein FdhE [Achromobacter marplatensis]